MDDILQIAICSGLNFSYNPSTEKKALRQCPTNAFGVFSTVKRSYTIEEWPYDIHGCIGYWTDDYKKISKKILLDKIKDVSHKATHSDSRKNYFKIPLTKDSHSLYELNFMMRPLYDIDSISGRLSNSEMFDNNIYGLIAVSQGGNRATYLPKVFPKTTWEEIKKSLKQKASIMDDVTFKAYRTIEVEKPIYQLFESKYISHLHTNFKQFIEKFYTTFVPYSYQTKVLIDKEQYVRNCATLYDILQFGNPSLQIKKKIVRDIKYYLELYHANPLQMRQASSFLLLACHELNLPIKPISDYLYQSIDLLESRFELGEVLIALNEVHPAKTILLRKQNEMYHRLLLLKTPNEDDIFEFNWQSKFLHSLYKNKKIKKTTTITKHGELLKEHLLSIIAQFSETYETNYIAVGLESLCSLLPLVDDKQQLWDSIVYLYSILQKRYKNGLFYFKNGVARLDITGHVLNGLIL